MFVKVRKTFQGGAREVNLWIEGSPNDHEIQWIVEEWAENSPGGHNYGYSFRWEKVPTTEELIDYELHMIGIEGEKVAKRYIETMASLAEKKEALRKERSKL